MSSKNVLIFLTITPNFEVSNMNKVTMKNIYDWKILQVNKQQVPL